MVVGVCVVAVVPDPELDVAEARRLAVVVLVVLVPLRGAVVAGEAGGAPAKRSFTQASTSVRPAMTHSRP